MPGRKSYIGRTNLNATQVTRATHSRLANDFVSAAAARSALRAERWVRANPNRDIRTAPRHILAKAAAWFHSGCGSR